MGPRPLGQRDFFAPGRARPRRPTVGAAPTGGALTAVGRRAQADQKLRAAGPGVGGDRLAVGLVNQAELALERGDQEAARRALREARQAVRGQGEEAQQAQQGQQRPANPSGSGDGGARPQQGGGQQQGAAAGASGQPAR